MASWIYDCSWLIVGCRTMKWTNGTLLLLILSPHSYLHIDRINHRQTASSSISIILLVTFDLLLSFLQAAEAQSQLRQGKSILLCIPTAIPTMWTVPGLSVWIPTTEFYSTSLTWTLNIIATAPGTMWL